MIWYSCGRLILANQTSQTNKQTDKWEKKNLFFFQFYSKQKNKLIFRIKLNHPKTKSNQKISSSSSSSSSSWIIIDHINNMKDKVLKKSYDSRKRYS
jgi:hypothetical protein